MITRVIKSTLTGAIRGAVITQYFALHHHDMKLTMFASWLFAAFTILRFEMWREARVTRREQFQSAIRNPHSAID